MKILAEERPAVRVLDDLGYAFIDAVLVVGEDGRLLGIGPPEGMSPEESKEWRWWAEKIKP